MVSFGCGRLLQGCETYPHVCACSHDADAAAAAAAAAADADNEPIWPTWAVDTLFRSMRCTHIKHVCEKRMFSPTPVSLR